MERKGNRKYYFLLAPIFAVLLLTMVGTAVQAEDATWTTRFYNNKNLAGDPVWKQQDQTINFDWGHGSPVPGVVNDDNFSAKWTRRVNFQPGTYRFVATMDDAMRVYIDGNIIIDSWTDSQEHTVVHDVALSGGEHDLQVDYYEAGGVAVAKFNWQLVSSLEPEDAYPNWKTEYYNNTTLTGAPVLVRDEPYIDNNWGYGSPAPGIVNNDFFSVRWTKTLNGVAAPYHIFIRSDDGSRLYINDVLIIDNWNVQAPTTKAADYFYPGGPVRIRVEYFENTERASIVTHLARIPQ